MAESHPDSWHGQNDPFREDSFEFPYGEETRERARIVHEHNLDALRHVVEVPVWEMFDHPELMRSLVPVLWLLKDVDRRWIAEALCMNVLDVCVIVEANPIMSANCLDCGVALPAKDRNHLLLMNESLKALCEDLVVDQGHLTNLLCRCCSGRRAHDEDEQIRLDHARLQALLAEYRKVPYAERRRSKEWLC